METLQNIIIKAHYLDVPYHKNLRKVFKLKKIGTFISCTFFLVLKFFASQTYLVLIIAACRGIWCHLKVVPAKKFLPFQKNQALNFKHTFHFISLLKPQSYT